MIGKPDPAYLNEGVFLLYAIQALDVYKNLHRRINELIPLTKIGSKILINLFDRDGFCFLHLVFSKNCLYLVSHMKRMIILACQYMNSLRVLSWGIDMIFALILLWIVA